MLEFSRKIFTVISITLVYTVIISPQTSLSGCNHEGNEKIAFALLYELYEIKKSWGDSVNFTETVNM